MMPLPGPAISHRASLYADDLVVLVAPLQEDLDCLHRILLLFATPIRCTEDMINTVQQVFPYVVAPFPCKYLGIPLSLGRLRRVEEQALVDAVAARIPTWKSGLLTHVRWAGAVDEGNVICDSGTPVHSVLLVELGNPAIRSTREPRIPLVGHRSSRWRKMQGHMGGGVWAH